MIDFKKTYCITVELLDSHKYGLIKFVNGVNAEYIHKIYTEYGIRNNIDYKTHSYPSPEHMVNRYIENMNDAAVFYATSDVDCKMLLNRKFFELSNGFDIFRMMEFFKWIRCSLAAHSVEALLNPKSGQLWKILKNVHFFF